MIKLRNAGTVRLSQFILQSGPGAVLDLRAVSVVPRAFDDTLKFLFRDEEIPDKYLIHDDYLISVLKGKFPRLKGIVKILPKMKYDPETNTSHLENQDVLVRIFPEWVFCPSCRRLDSLDNLRVKNADGKRIYLNNIPHKCNDCFKKIKDLDGTPNLVPARLVTACENGHLNDFPWIFWAHLGFRDCKISNNRKKKNSHLKIYSLGKSSQLKDLIVTCTSCNSRQDLGRAFESGNILEKIKCDGRSPELGTWSECGLHPKPLLRGATNLYFSVIESALSIITDISVRDPRLEVIAPLVRGEIDTGFLKMANSVLDYNNLPPFNTTEEISNLLKGDEKKDIINLRPREYLALTENLPLNSDHLIVEEFETSENSLHSQYFSRIILVKKLREIIVNTGFTRIQHVKDAFSIIDGSLNDSGVTICHVNRDKQFAEYLPGVEFSGEGILFVLDPKRLDRWKTKFMDERASMIVRSAEDRQVSPFFILTHSLSHALITALSEVVGYSISSLRERLYVSLSINNKELVPAILIYTAGADSEGSLGGLIRVARNNLIDNILERMNEIMYWCASDPICIETSYDGGQFYNHAACHACLFLPETSCELVNQYLDRVTLVGMLDRRDIGYLNIHGDEE